MKIKNILLIIIIGILIIISTQNTQEVNIKLIFWDITTSLIILIYIIFVISFLLGMIFSGMKRAVRERKEKKIQKQKERSQKKLQV